MDAVAASVNGLQVLERWPAARRCGDGLLVPFFRLRGLARFPLAALRPWPGPHGCVCASPATSSVSGHFLDGSAPIFSYGSSSSISLAMLTPSLVMVGAPHFFSSTTLRPLGPRVTLTASARMFIPRSRPRRASVLNRISLGMFSACPVSEFLMALRTVPATDGPLGAFTGQKRWHSLRQSANAIFSTLPMRVQTAPLVPGPPESISVDRRPCKAGEWTTWIGGCPGHGPVD